MCMIFVDTENNGMSGIFHCMWTCMSIGLCMQIFWPNGHNGYYLRSCLMDYDRFVHLLSL